MSRTGSALTGAALVVSCLATVAAPAQARFVPGADGLSPRLLRLSRPAMRDASPEAQAAALSLAAEGPGSLQRRGGRVLTEVRFQHGAVAALPGLRAAGAQVVNASPRYQTVSVAARPADLRAIAAVPGVASARPALAPVTAAACPSGSVVSQGDTQLNAAAARADFGVDGTGVKVGILSDSFDRDPTAPTNAAADAAAGDLPGTGNPCGNTVPVEVLEDDLSSGVASDEGRGMAQIVHDLAPGARLSFATAFFSDQTSFADNIRALATAGAKVIVDDVSYFEEPFFQDGPVAVAANEVTADGATYLTAAGNDNLIDKSGHDIGSWEAPEFRDSGACPAQLEALTEAHHCMNFDPGAGVDDTFGITVEDGETLTLDLQWAEPWNGVDADIDAYLLDATGKPLLEGGEAVGSYENNVGEAGTQIPAEVFEWENETGEDTEVQLAINLCFDEGPSKCNPDGSSTVRPRLKFILLENGGGVSGTEYPTSKGGDVVGPAVYGHAGATGAISVGAVPVGDSSAPEAYSSRGPVTHLFGPVTGNTAAAEIAAQTISKPDLVAGDCGLTSFFFTPSAGGFTFCGTSAAAPHAAAVAALALQANPSLTPAQITSALEATARPVAGFGPLAVGAGLVDAHAMIEGHALPPTIKVTGPPKAVSRNRSPSIAFEASRPVQFSCQLDGASTPCRSPFVPSEPLADGEHGFVVGGVDLAGRQGASQVVHFRVDTVPPKTFFKRRPRRNLRTHHRRAKAIFVFGSNAPGSTFTCRVDGGLPRLCRGRLVARFAAGRHVVRVKAVDEAGNVDASPAVARVRVRRLGASARR